MKFEYFWKKREETKSSNAWRRAMEEREIEKNLFHVTGKLDEAREFAAAAMQETQIPVQQPIAETITKPIVIFSKDVLAPMDFVKLSL